MNIILKQPLVKDHLFVETTVADLRVVSQKRDYCVCKYTAEF